MDVRFIAKRLYLDWLVTMISRPGYTRLPPANYWHNHPGGHQWIGGPGLYVGFYMGKRAKRKWVKEYISGQRRFDPSINPNAYLPEKPYVYCDPRDPVRRTALACRILDDVEANGGEPKDTLITKSKNVNDVLKVIRAKPGITRSQLEAEFPELAFNQLTYALTRNRRLGRIKRVGSPRAARWYPG